MSQTFNSLSIGLAMLLSSQLATGQDVSSSPESGAERIVDATTVKIRANRPIKIEYYNPQWNQNPRTPDSGYFIFKNLVNQKIFLVELIETSDQSGIFQSTITPDVYGSDLASFEIYLPLNNRKLTSETLVEETRLIQKGFGARKPYFYRIEKGQSRITIFDSKAEALEAYRYFIRTGQSKDLINPNLLENQAAQSPDNMLALKELSDLESQLSLQLAARSTQFLNLPPQEQAQKKSDAQKTYQKALNAYSKDQFEEARRLFEESLDLDPTERSYLFELGVTYYRLNQYQKCVAYLNQAQTPKTDDKNYFLGLCYLKLKRSDLAYEIFSQLKESQNYKAISFFYLGLLDYQQERWRSAEQNFRTTIEYSADEELDKASQGYLNQLREILWLEEQQKKKYTLTGFLGAQYNSNILTVSPVATATDLDGFRTIYGLGGEWRPLFTASEEFLIQVSLSDTYSVNKQFKANSDFQKFDPLIFQVNAPYRWKGILNDQSSLVALSPFFRSLMMDPTGEGSRSEFLNSLGINADLALNHSTLHSAIYSLEMRKDNVFTSASSGDNNQNAIFMGLNSSQTFLRESATGAWLVEGGLGLNQALGRNQRFRQLAIGGGFLTSAFSDALWISKVNYTHRNFWEHLTGRTDQLLALQLLLQKPLNKQLQLSSILGYTRSESDFAPAKFDQWIIMAQLIWQNRF